MRTYIGFDDTDDKDAPMGTGRLVREFMYGLPQTCTPIGVVRHQLPRFSDIPFTSNNSSACAIVEIADDSTLAWLKDHAREHILAHCALGSDPGLCVAEESQITSGMIEYGQAVTGMTKTQQDAITATSSIFLEGLGGTNDGIIGAAAAVGLTKYGWCGRFIEFKRLRSLGRDLRVADLEETGIRVVSVDRDPLVPLPSDRIVKGDWIRPSLWGGQPVLQVKMLEQSVWEPAHTKRKKDKKLQPGMKVDATTTRPYTS
ncbi:conserved protein of unknown function [Pseudodesulfovibrio profundus]|uniref:DUF1743 domain-containing protein n=1 Tax=Pseudodesulfovibrio profundus TaxID=57320 RepID=A0A2C8FC44_9BACT|nr:hypothetical protein [Pseudodesulfovibrio profundus]SOB60021.1 conserved protein of unknown function [Pseudodesulfovibrio profundus]